MKQVKVGLIGFGTVGSGVVKIFKGNAELVNRRVGAPLVLEKIADLDIERDRGVEVERSLLTTRAEEVLDGPDIDIVIELVGGLEPARSFILRAIENGKHVVTANKALLANHGEELFGAAARKGVCISFEASVGGGIPIIRAIRDGFPANRFHAIQGIVNGTANYILSKMTEEGRPFGEVLEEAKKLGYAEADPTYDVEGIDSAHKIAILASLAFGIPVNLKAVFCQGISDITPLDIQFAREFGYRIKLLAIAKRVGREVEIRVHPALIPEESLLASVGGVYNAINVVGDMAGPNTLIGQGAGSLPTASAVMGDVIEISRELLKGVKGSFTLPARSRDPESKLRVRDINKVETEYYLRFTVMDRPGVLSRISGILGASGISIASVIQKGRKAGGAVPLVMMTHTAREEDAQKSLREITRFDFVLDDTMMIRVENGEPA